MRSFAIVAALLTLFGLLLLVGCSKDEDVAELEKEMKAQQEGMVDTVTDTVVTPPPKTPDTVSRDMDAGAIPSEEQAMADMPTRPAGTGYEVQLASTTDSKYAGYLVDRFRQRGYEPYVTEATVGGQRYYRIRIGLFDTYSAAKAAAFELEDRYSIEPWIEPVS
jgi:cell division septation protein DedD